MREPFTLGVNYWPRRKAMYWWADFDEEEVREEFGVIKDLGLELVRIFLLWDDWQPSPDSVSKPCLKNLGAVCDAASEYGLKLDVTFFTGHMSGPNWAPGWLLDKTLPVKRPGSLISGGEHVSSWYRNYYLDPTAQEAQRLLLKTVVDAYKDHEAIGMWNLGNEPDLFAIAPNQRVGQAWLADMIGVIKSLDPEHPVTCGLHIASLLHSRAPRVDQAFALTDVAVMHAYPMYMPWLENPLEPWFVPFTCALTTALCGKPTLMEEFGSCTAPPGVASEVWAWEAYGQPRTQFMASEEALASYFEEVLPKLVQVGATGAMSWCYADYVPELWDKAPCLHSIHERHFGLVRPDGSLKPHAKTIKRFAASKPTVQAATAKFELDVTPDEYYHKPDEHLKRLYARFLEGL